MRERIGMRIGDAVLMALLALVALLLFFLPRQTAGEAKLAEIVQLKTGESRQILLAEDAEYVITSGDITLTVSVSSGNVHVSHAACRDRICMNTPAISRAGQSIVCVPAGVIVRVVGEEADADAISG